jgi:hypothetical protein
MPQSIGPSDNMSEWSDILGAKRAGNIRQIQTLFRTAKREMEKQKLVNIALYTKFNIGPMMTIYVLSIIRLRNFARMSHIIGVVVIVIVW